MTPRMKLLIAVPAALIALACASGKTGTTQPAHAPQQTEAASPSPAKYTPAPTDFTLGVKITEKHCFGEAGCNVTYRITVTYGGLPLSTDDEWLVTYTVTGGEDGPQINSFTIRGEEIRYDGTEFLTAPKSTTVITAKVTAVAPN